MENKRSENILLRYKYSDTDSVIQRIVKNSKRGNKVSLFLGFGKWTDEALKSIFRELKKLKLSLIQTASF